MTEDEKRMEKHRWPTLIKYVMAEELSGVSEEALLLLKRTPMAEPWGTWGDFDKGVPLLVAQEAARQRAPDEKLLKVEVYYAESDSMSGKTGCKWFDQCWNREGYDGVIEFVSETWPKTTHESILDRKLGLLDRWVAGVAKMYEEDWDR